MRLFTAIALLFAASCTFDYGALKGTGQDGGGDAGGREVFGAVDAPARSDAGDAAAEAGTDAAVDAQADRAFIAVDSSVPGDVPVDVPIIGVEDAAPDGEPSADGAVAMDTGGTGGGSFDGGHLGTGGATGGVTGLGGSTASGGSGGHSSGGVGGTVVIGGAGGSSVDAGVDGAGVDAGVDASLDMAADTSPDTYVADTYEPPIICSPSQNACVGNEYSLCNSAGTAWTSIQDCSSKTGCSLPLGGCYVVDTLPFDPTDTINFRSLSVTNAMKVNYYAVTTARTLLKFEQYLNQNVGDTLHWAIYRSTTRDGSFSLDKYYSSTAVASADGYQASPVLNYALEANTYYGLAVWWETNTVTYWNHSTAAGFPMSLASGGMTVIGGLSPGLTGVSPLVGSSISAPTSTTLYYPQRLTTR